MPNVHELRATLESSHQDALALFDRLTRADLARPTENENWSVREHLVHLAISEPGLQQTIRGALRDEWVVPADFDLDRWNQRQVERHRELTPDQLRARLVENRQATLALLEEIGEADLARQARHASLRVITLAEFFSTIVEHERSHLAEVAAALDPSNGPS